jgi:hypothetical protein
MRILITGRAKAQRLHFDQGFIVLVVYVRLRL